MNDYSLKFGDVETIENFLSYSDICRIVEIEEKYAKKCPEFGNPEALEHNRLVEKYSPLSYEQAEEFLGSIGVEIYKKKLSFLEKVDKLKIKDGKGTLETKFEDFEFELPEMVEVEADPKDYSNLSIDDFIESVISLAETLEKDYVENIDNWLDIFKRRYASIKKQYEETKSEMEGLKFFLDVVGKAQK